MTRQQSAQVQQEAESLWFASPGAQQIKGVQRSDFEHQSGKCQQHYRMLARNKLGIK